MKSRLRFLKHRFAFLREPHLDSLEYRLCRNGFWDWTVAEKREWLDDAFALDASQMTERDIHSLIDGWLVWEEELDWLEDEQTETWLHEAEAGRP